MKFLIQIILLTLILTSCNSDIENLESHFHSNQAFYEELRLKIIKHPTGGQFVKPEELDQEIQEMIKIIPGNVNYIATGKQQCDSQLEITFYMQAHIQLTYHTCNPDFERTETAYFAQIPLTKNWLIWKEKDFI